MSLRAAFLRDVVESYDDDAPRLIYADWLEDTGDAARAEFIRVQCELERLLDEDGLLPEEGECPRAHELHARSEELRAAHGERWFPGLGGLVERYWVRRGFV